MLAGTAKIDITPSENVWMDGMIREHPSEGVHDPLFARALVLSNDENPASSFAVVSVDVCVLRTTEMNPLRERLEREVSIPASQLIVASTHTHSGPATAGVLNARADAYTDGLMDKLVEVVGQAAGSLRPVQVGVGRGLEDTISHYRRLLADNGKVVMNWEPYPPEHIVGPMGEIDPDVGLLKVVGPEGENVCLLFNHAGHPNVLSGDNYLISAEYPGLAERILEGKYGGMAMFFNGAQGTMDIDGLRDRDWEGMERVGKALAGAVKEAAPSIRPVGDAQLLFGSTRYTVPARQISDAEWQWAQEILAETGGKLQHLADGVGDDYKALLFSRLRAVQDRPIPVMQAGFAVGRPGDEASWGAFVSFPGEMFTEIGMEIKSKSPFEHTFIIGLANGQIGYLPTRKAIAEGGYAVSTRQTGDEAAEMVIDHSLVLLHDLHKRAVG